MKHEERTLCNRGNEPKMEKMKGKSLKPSPRSLLKTIKRFVQLANIGRMFGIFIPRRLYHMNLLLKKAM